MEGRQKNRKKQVEARKREGIESLGKDIWSMILPSLNLTLIRHLRLTNKHIEGKTRDYFFNECLCFISNIPLNQSIPSSVRRACIRTVTDYQRVHQSNICVSYITIRLYHYKQHLLIPHTTMANRGIQPFVVPSSVTYFEMGWFFNQPVTLPSNLIRLRMSESFNCSIVIPPSVTNLEMGHDFNLPIELPPNILHFSMGYAFNHHIDLPCSITHLSFGRMFNRHVKLPPNLQSFAGPKHWELLIPKTVVFKSFW
jgi:hypothetical protein